MAKYHVGIDLHKCVAQVCVLDERGEVLEEWRHTLAEAADGQALLGRLALRGAQARLAVEALGCNRWLVNGLKALGLEVLVVHAQALGLKKLGRKTDRRDAHEIARRLYLGDLERTARSHYPSEEAYGKRKLLRLRHVQRQALQRALNQVRALLNAYLVRPPVKTLLSKRGLAWLEQVELPTADLTFLLRHLLQDLLHQRTQIAVLDAEIAKLSGEAKVAALEELPQLGVLSAGTLFYELGDVDRFERTRQVAAYVGLVPRVSQSGEGHAHHGRLTKRGNSEVRWILTQWAVRLLIHEPLVKAWAARHARRLPKNKLRVALARRLLIGVYKMMSTGEMFSMQRCLGLPTAA
jgi:transposase